MDFLPEEILQYTENHTTAEPEYLARIKRDTHANVLKPRMLSGHLQGRVLAMISQILKPKHILEIGTYTGYSAICLAEGLQPGGAVVTIDINEELAPRVRRNLEIAGVVEKIDYRIGNALEIVPTLSHTFDLVFIDADKMNYSAYFDLVIDKVRDNGIILADNVLWSGKVVDGSKDKDTMAILEFNAKVHTDKRVENVLLPIRDGIMMIRKVSL